MSLTESDTMILFVTIYSPLLFLAGFWLRGEIDRIEHRGDRDESVQ